MSAPSPTDRDPGPLGLRLDRRRLFAVLLDFLAGTGILALYVTCVVGSLYLAGMAVVALRGSIALPGEWLRYLAGVVGLAVWFATYRAALHLFVESGVELGRVLRWLLFPAAPVAFALSVMVHLLGAIATDTRGPLRMVGSLLGVLVLFTWFAGLLSLLL